MLWYEGQRGCSRRLNRCGVGPFNKFLFPVINEPPLCCCPLCIVCVSNFPALHRTRLHRLHGAGVKRSDKCGPSQVMPSKQGLIKILQGVLASNHLRYARAKNNISQNIFEIQELVIGDLELDWMNASLDWICARCLSMPLKTKSEVSYLCNICLIFCHIYFIFDIFVQCLSDIWPYLNKKFRHLWDNLPFLCNICLIFEHIWV